ncbi:protein translocase subunit SecD [Nesterenkonia flava]
MRRARLALVALFILLLGMGGALAYGVQEGRAQWAPLLALDLEGGTQMVLAPQAEGGEQIDDEQLEQAVEIIRQRVDGTGVAEAEIATQGAENVVVSLPGTPDEETRQLIQASADMDFRPVLQIGRDDEYAEDVLLEELRNSGDLTEEELAELEADMAAQAEEQNSEDEATSDEEEAAASEDEESEESANDQRLPEPRPEDNSSLEWVTPQLAEEFENYSCSRELTMEERAAQAPDEPLITCDPNTGTTYLLGPVDVPGTMIDGSSYGLEQTAQGTSTGRWAVDVQFDGEGTAAFRESSARLHSFPQGDVRNQFAVVLDGHVIVAPSMRAVIGDGRAQITGDFTEEEARTLSEQLRYGSLPVSFTIESEQQISATLGQDQLRMGLLAGIIGLVLTAGYALYQYRALALAVTIPSLIVVGVLTWWAISLLGWTDGYRLSLAGIAGLILSIGLTADSFVVYFERVKDELREGRSLPAAVESGWSRARRTILASKAVNVLAAVVLYLVAVGNVRGFAFTLGLTALIDVILVFLFTHPLMQLLARRKFFAAGKRFSGLSAAELGVDVLYRGAGRFSRRAVVYSEDAAQAVDAAAPGKDSAASDRAEELPDVSEEEWATMTIAERRRARAEAAARRAAASADGSDSEDSSDSMTEAHSSGKEER